MINVANKLRKTTLLFLIGSLVLGVSINVGAQGLSKEERNAFKTKLELILKSHNVTNQIHYQSYNYFVLDEKVRSSELFTTIVNYPQRAYSLFLSADPDAFSLEIILLLLVIYPELIEDFSDIFISFHNNFIQKNSELAYVKDVKTRVEKYYASLLNELLMRGNVEAALNFARKLLSISQQDITKGYKVFLRLPSDFAATYFIAHFIALKFNKFTITVKRDSLAELAINEFLRIHKDSLDFLSTNIGDNESRFRIFLREGATYSDELTMKGLFTHEVYQRVTGSSIIANGNNFLPVPPPPYQEDVARTTAPAPHARQDTPSSNAETRQRLRHQEGGGSLDEQNSREESTFLLQTEVQGPQDNTTSSEDIAVSNSWLGFFSSCCQIQ